MPAVRGHEPVVIEEFNGLWSRGDHKGTPTDHFIQADNVQYIATGFETRETIDPYQPIPMPGGVSPILGIRRMYTYLTNNGQTLILLQDGGSFWHVRSPTDMNLFLSIPEAEDFGFVAINGRAYISPFKNYVDVTGINYQLGLKNVPIYVYDGSAVTPGMARPAGGAAPVGGAMIVTNAGAGLTDTGDHLFAVVFETDTGYLTALGPDAFTMLDLNGTNGISFSNIPVGPPGSGVIKRHLVATKAITDYNGDQIGYQFFFIPAGNIDDNTSTTKTGVHFFDSDLLSDASHLIDNFAQIPSGVNLTIYHSRMVIVGEFGRDDAPLLPGGKPNTENTLPVPPDPRFPDNRNVARVSHPGEPEAFSKIDGLLVVPRDGNPLTNAQEFRDVLYLFKKSRTFAYSDNQDEPSTWQEEVVDQGCGAPVHGIATVLDSGGVNIDYLLIANFSGLTVFNGVFTDPELSWKVDNIWKMIDRNQFHLVQLINDTICRRVYVTIPEPFRHMMFYIDYENGLNSKDCKWARWIFNTRLSTLAILHIDKIILGMYLNYDLPFSSLGGLYILSDRSESGDVQIPMSVRDLYMRQDGAVFSTVEVKVPDPTVRTGIFGE